MATKKPAPKPPKLTHTTLGVLRDTPIPPKIEPNWRNPDWKPADDDQGLEARMWRLAHQ